MSQEWRMVAILFIVLLYSPWLLFYSIIGSIFNTKIILLLVLILLATIIHLLVMGIKYLTFVFLTPLAKRTINDNTDGDKLSKTRESWKTKIYEEIVFRCIILNILLNMMTIKYALLITSLLSDGPRFFFILRVYFYGTPNESNQAKIRLAKRALNIVFTSFAGYVAAFASGGLLFPILIYCYLNYVVYPVVDDLVLKHVDDNQKTAASSYLALIIVFGILFVLIF